MAKAETKFATNQLVKIKGRPEAAKVTWPMVVPIPTIVNGEFILSNRVMYKFINERTTFYAWEDDVTASSEANEIRSKKGRKK